MVVTQGFSVTTQKMPNDVEQLDDTAPFGSRSRTKRGGPKPSGGLHFLQSRGLSGEKT